MVRKRNFENFENGGTTTSFKVFRVEPWPMDREYNSENSETGGVAAIFRVFIV